MKIVHVEDYFHPDAGYQLNILCRHLVKLGHEVVIITSKMDKTPANLSRFFDFENIDEKDASYTRKYGVKIIRLPIHGFVSGRGIFTKTIYKTIQLEKPDLVYIHGNDTLTGMRYLMRHNRMGFPLIMDSHMLEMAATNKFNKLFRWFYRHFFAPKLIKHGILVIRTQNDPYVEKCLGVPLEQAPWISIGSDTMLFKPDDETKRQFRQKYDIPQNAFVVLYAGKLDKNKGGLLLANTLQEKLPTNQEIVFLIVGKASGEYGEKVEELLKKSKNRILRFPTQKHCDLAPFYQAADLALFPKQCSLSFYDVQACGLPVLFEDNNINIERSKNGNALTFVSGDMASFREKLTLFANMPKTDWQAMSDNAISYIKNGYDYAEITKEYLDCFIRTVENHH